MSAFAEDGEKRIRQLIEERGRGRAWTTESNRDDIAGNVLVVNEV